MNFRVPSSAAALAHRSTDGASGSTNIRRYHETYLRIHRAYHVAIQGVPHAITENRVAKLQRGVSEVTSSRGRVKHSQEDLRDTNIGS